LVVEVTTNGAVPSATVDVSWSVAERAVNAPLDAVVLPIGPVKAVDVIGPTEFDQSALTPSDDKIFPLAPA
jgi:hypothetical protein